MRTLAELWPPYAVRITEHELTLTVATDEDLPRLVDLALSGIHPPELMPFAVPWTDADPDHLPANMIRHFSSVRAEFRPEKFDLLFAVRIDDTVIGIQAFHTTDFAVTRTGETGSWLGRSYQGRGYGTRMRRAACSFAFDELGATEITSGAFHDNPRSLAVSRKVGYQPNGTVRMQRRSGELATNYKLVLTPSTFIRGEPITVSGATALRAFLGLPA
ncbi:MAG TPA: GNAT family protein [Microlunatus sp.]|nr:GNAT family protein [Microlunatus sp.]